MKKVVFILFIFAVCCVALAANDADVQMIKETAADISVPDGLSEHEAEIYKEGYRAGYYAAQHGTVDERHPENDMNHYVVNISSGRFHYPSCNGVQSMSESNKMDFYGTREEAMAQGYKPCGMCDP